MSYIRRVFREMHYRRLIRCFIRRDILKIENNNLDILMKNVEVGKCFIYKGELHMKIDRGCIEVNTSYSNLVIDLHTNRLNAIADDAIVGRVNAKIVVG